MKTTDEKEARKRMQTKKRVQRFRKRQKQQYELLVKNKKNRDAVRKCRSGVLHANK